MKQQLDRLDAWLAAHAPDILASLQPPAPAKGGPWSRLEADLGFTLTEDFHALYAAHNGQRLKGPGLFEGLRWLTLDQVLERYRDDDGDYGAADWPDAWVPLAGDAIRTLVIDFGEAPAPVVLVDRDGVGEPLAATLRGYLTKVVDDATAGRRQLVAGRGLVVV